MASSYLNTPLQGSYMYESLPDRLRHLAEEDGDREAFVYYDRTWTRRAITRRELLDQATSLAKVLIESGLKPKANVGFCMTNSLNMLFANMAVVCAGGVPFYRGTSDKDGNDLMQVLNDMECQIFFIDADDDSDNYRIMQNIWPESDTECVKVPTLKQLIYNGNIQGNGTNKTNLACLMRKTPTEHTHLPEVQPEDTLACFCTSGSTGMPKDVIYTHFSIFNWTKQSNYIFEMTSKSRFFCDRTFSWVVGYPRTYLVEGTTRIFVDPRLTSAGHFTEKIADIVQQERCDVVYVPNYIAADLLKAPHLSEKFTNVRTCVFSGERFSKASTAFRGKFCQKICSYYGTTEAGGIANFLSDDIDVYEDGIIGVPLPGVEVKLVDGAGAVVPRGAQGEICMRTAWRFVGYRGNDDAFRAAVDNSNWFHTGDMAHIRADGNIIIEGRRKELISVQTVKFFPWQPEKKMKKMPGIKDAFVVGVPDVRSGESVCACVVPQEGVVITPDDVRQFCDENFLAESSVTVVTAKPRYHVILDSVPLTRSGKINRMEIAAMAKAKLGL